MLIDDVAKVVTRLDAGNVDEDAILAELRLQALEQAACLPLGIIATVTDEDARHSRPRLTPKSQEFSTRLHDELTGPIRVYATGVF